MKAWIDEYGDVVWNDTGTFYSRNTWTNYLIDGCCLIDGCRFHDPDKNVSVGMWMILE